MSKGETNPDLYVLCHVALGVQETVNGFGNGPGPYGWHGGLDSFVRFVRDQSGHPRSPERVVVDGQNPNLRLASSTA